jgi:hypothetical protein
VLVYVVFLVDVVVWFTVFVVRYGFDVVLYFVTVLLLVLTWWTYPRGPSPFPPVWENAKPTGESSPPTNTAMTIFLSIVSAAPGWVAERRS